MQLTDNEIEAIYREFRSSVNNPPERINYRWVDQSGVYDITHEFMGSSYQTREFVYGGRICYVANRSWVENPTECDRLPSWMRAPWGTYPDLPQKPPKE